MFVELGPRPDERARRSARAARRIPADVRQRGWRPTPRRSSPAIRDRRSALLPLLHLVQSEDGYLTPAGIEFCAAATRPDRRRGHRGRHVLLDVPAQPDRRVPGRRVHQHAVRGHGRRRDPRRAARSTSASHAGETTDDGKITLEHVECNAACDYAPVVMVNWEFFDNQTPSSASELVDELRAGEPRRADPRRAAVHVPRDRPNPCRVPRRPPGRRGRASPGDRHAGRAASRPRELAPCRHRPAPETTDSRD